MNSCHARGWTSFVSALLISVILLLGSCGNLDSGPPAGPAVNIAGTWEGSSSAGCFLTGHRCNAYRIIGFTFIQSGSDLSGSYTCGYGTMNCLGLNNAGTVVYGRIDGPYMPDLRIAFPDATNCLYQGHFMGNEGQHFPGRRR